jgi:transcription initiation factor TFIID subunit 12
MSQPSSSGAGSSSMANAPASTDSPAVAQNDMIKALGNIVKSQTGEPISNEKISQLLLANMATLVQQGKLTQKQIIQVWTWFHDMIPLLFKCLSFAS